MSIIEKMRAVTLALHDCGFERTPREVRKLLGEWQPNLTTGEVLDKCIKELWFFNSFLSYVEMLAKRDNV